MKDNKATNHTAAQPAVFVSFLEAENPLETHIVSSAETEARGRDFINWGPRNDFPDYLYMLYKNVATLRTVISGCVDYVAGNAVRAVTLQPDGTMNSKGDSLRNVYRAAARSFWLYGGCAMNVIRDGAGRVSEIYPVDMRYLRSNRENTLFYYSEDWSKRWGKSRDLTYCAFDRKIGDEWAAMDERAREAHASTIAYFKDEDSGTYPVCQYEAAIKDCEIERMIEEFHLNDLNNGFAASYLINFLNGIPEEDVRREIEKKFTRKLTGFQNAGRPIFSYSPDLQHSTKLTKLESAGFEERYKALAGRARSQIYASFRANPNLFGIATESNGFNSEEYEKTFQLFNRTMIQPMQQTLVEAFGSIYDANMTIVPFTLDGKAGGGAEG